MTPKDLGKTALLLLAIVMLVPLIVVMTCMGRSIELQIGDILWDFLLP